jgi:hypothetical protein
MENPMGTTAAKTGFQAFRKKLDPDLVKQWQKAAQAKEHHLFSDVVLECILKRKHRNSPIDITRTTKNENEFDRVIRWVQGGTERLESSSRRRMLAFARILMKNKK